MNSQNINNNQDVTGNYAPSADVSKLLRQRQVLDYYTESLNDFADWSQAQHMHFGYMAHLSQAGGLEDMLVEMTQQVLTRLSLDQTRKQNMIDLGCGLGASCRLAAEQFTQTQFHGVSLVPAQIDYAKQVDSSVKYFCADYTDLPFENNYFDGAYAIESSCYAKGLDKYDFLTEAYRVLKPGARLIVADGFLKHTAKLGPLLSYSHQRLCDSWAFETLADIDVFTQRMQQIGFRHIQIEDISWKVAPSFAYIPFVTLKFVFKELLTRKRKFNRLTWGHVIAPLHAILVGLSRRHFGYYIVSAEKTQ